MTSPLVYAIGAQWVALAALGVLTLGLARQIGVLHQRLGPAGALMLSKRARVGEASPEFRLRSLDGGEVVIGGASDTGRMTLLMFVAPDCPVCAKLTPVARSIGVAERQRVRVVFASDGDPAEHRRYRAEKRLEGFDYVLSAELGRTFEIGKLPYAVLLDRDGVVASQGLVNSREHLESLFEAHRTGIASIQDFLAQDRDRQAVARSG